MTTKPTYEELEQKVKELEKKASKRKQAEEKLEQHLASLLHYSSLAIVTLDDKHRIISCNRYFENLFQFEEPEILGKNLDQVIARKEYIKDAMSYTKKTLRGEAIHGFGRRYRKDGTLIDVEFTGVPVVIEGKVAGAYGIYLDITDRKQTEEALRESEEKFRTFMETASDLMHMADKNGNITYVNESMAKTLGYSKEEMIGMHITQVISKESLKNFKPDLEELITKGGISLEVAWVTKDGKEICVEGRVVGIYDSDGKFAGSRAVFRDITERKQAEQEAQRRAAQLELIYGVGQRMISKLELGALLSEIVTAVHDAFGYYGVMLLLVDEETERLTMQSIAGGYSDIFPKGLWLAIGEGMIWYAAASGKTQLSGDVSKHPHYVRKAKEETNSELAVPIKSGQKVIGVLDIQSDEFDAFDETEVMLMETLADQVAVAIENARLYETVQQELTERKRAQEALRESEERLKTLIENAPDGIYVIDPMTGRFIDGNRKAEKLVGYPREELIGKNFVEAGILPEEYIPKAMEGLEKNRLGQPTGPDEYELLRKDGSRVFVEIMSFPVARKGKVEIIGIARDTSDRKRAEEELRKFKTISDRADYGSAISDLEGNLIYVNESFAQIHGYAADDLIGKNLSIFHNEEQMKTVNRLKEQLRQKGSYVAEEVWHIRKDNSVFPTSMNGTLIRDEQGKPQFMAATAIDITEHKRDEEALRESEGKFRLLSEQNLLGIVILQDGLVKYVNKAASEITEYSIEEALE